MKNCIAYLCLMGVLFAACSVEKRLYRPGWHISRLTSAPKPAIRPEVKKKSMPEPAARPAEDQALAEASLGQASTVLSHAPKAHVQRTFSTQRRASLHHKKLEAAQSKQKANANQKEQKSLRQPMPDERHIFAWAIGLATLLFFRFSMPMGYKLIALAFLLVAGGFYKRRYQTMNGWNWTILPNMRINRRQFLYFIASLSIIIFTWFFPFTLPYLLMIKIVVGGFWVVRQAVMVMRKDGGRRNPLTKPDSAFWNHWTGKRWNRLGYFLQALMVAGIFVVLLLEYWRILSAPLFYYSLFLAAIVGFLLLCSIFLLESGKRVLGTDNNREAQKQANAQQGGRSGEKFLTHKIDRLVVFCLAALVGWFLWQIFAYGVLGFGVGRMLEF